MANTVASPAGDARRKMISASLIASESLGKKNSDHEIARDFGRDIERALELGSITPAEATAEAELYNETAISKLIHPEKATTLARLLKLPRFRRAYALALFESCDDVQVQTTVTLQRKAVNQ